MLSWMITHSFDAMRQLQKLCIICKASLVNKNFPPKSIRGAVKAKKKKKFVLQTFAKKAKWHA